MHLLFATSIVPDGALASGYEIANAAIIDALRRAGARVTVIGFTWPGKARRRSRTTPSCLVPSTCAPRALHRCRSSPGLPGACCRGRHLRIGEAARGLRRGSARRRRAPRAVRRLCAQFRAVRRRIRKAVRRPASIFVAHNVELRSAARKCGRRAAARSSACCSAARRGCSRAWKSRLCRRARFVFTLADEDRAALGVDSDDRSAALPLVTRRPCAGSTRQRRIECDAALIGTWTWQPNRIGLEWFLDKVVPHLPADFRISDRRRHAVRHHVHPSRCPIRRPRA